MFYLLNLKYRYRIFCRQGKVRALGIISKSDKFVKFFHSLGSLSYDDEVETASEFVSILYGFGSNGNVNEVRYKKLISMTGKIAQVTT